MNTGAVLFIMIFMVPITAILVASPVGKALAKRIAGRVPHDDGVLLAEVEQLRTELDHVRGELLEVHERLDFAERMLAKGPASPAGVRDG